MNSHAERRTGDAQSTKAASEAKQGESRLLGFAKASTEAVEAAFKRDTVGLQTKEQFTSIKANIEKQVQAEQDLRQKAAEECVWPCFFASPRSTLKTSRQTVRQRRATGVCMWCVRMSVYLTRQRVRSAVPPNENTYSPRGLAGEYDEQ